MKKLLFLALALPAAGTVHAQEPNSILAFGRGYFTSQGAHSVSIGLGYQLKNNWTFGATFSESYDNWSPGAYSSHTKSRSAGLFARYSHYFGDSKTFFWYGQAGVARYSSFYENRDPNSLARDWRYANVANVTGGVGINFWKGFAVNIEPGSLTLASGPSHYAGPMSAPFERAFVAEFGIRPQIIFSKNFKIGGHKKAEKPRED